MPVTKSNGNRYESWFVEHCWSPLVGGCLHLCSYSYAKRMYEKYSDDCKWIDKPHWAAENFKKMPDTDPVWKGLPKLPKGKIFVCHTTDLFAENIPDDWIKEILNHCGKFPESQFIFQTKNPAKYFDYGDLIPEGSWLGTTIETDDFLEYGNLGISKAPSVYDRYVSMIKLREWINTHAANTIPRYKLFLTIEPIIKCSVFILSKWVRRINPDLIFIGCDTGENNLPEPTRDELIELIEELKKITHVHVKKNAERILGDMTLHNWFKVIKTM